MNTVIPLETTGQDWANQLSHEGSGNGMLYLVALLAGKPDPQTLRAAAAELVRLQPVLGCRFDENQDPPVWSPVANGEAYGEFRADDLRQGIDLLTQRKRATGRQLEVVLLTTPEQSAVCLCLDHASTDGGGARRCLTLLARCYQRCLTGLPAAERLSLDRSDAQVYVRCGLPDYRMTLRREAPAAEPVTTMPYVGLDGRTVRYRWLSLPLSAMKRAEGTINDRVLAAYAMALSHACAEARTVAIHMTIDLRRYLDAGTAPIACNLSGMAAVSLNVQPSDSFADVLAAVRERTALLKAQHIGLSSAAMLTYLRGMPYRQAKGALLEASRKAAASGVSAPILSNLGLLAPDRFAFGTVNSGDVVRQTIINVAGEGFVFGLFNATDIHYNGGTLMADTLVATGVTDSNGCLSFSDNYPHGAYYIKELSAPAGWKLNPNSFPIVLDPAAKAEDTNVIRMALPETVHDELIYTTVTLTKKVITGEKTLPGATIEVSNSAGDVIYRAVTDKNGNVPDIPVTPGKYTFREVFAPSGYALNEAVMTFTVDESGNVTGDTTIRDDYTRVTLLKQDENGKPLAGVEFALMKADDTVLMRAVSDANGIVTFEQIPYGSYTIVETKPLSGYLNSNVEIKLTVDGSFINPDKPLATITNCHKRVRYLKVDTSGKPLVGVEFSLISVETKQVMEVVTSNEQGEFVFTKFDYGDWLIRETKAPEGFIPMQDITLHVDESWTEPAPITCVNVPNHYEFIKVDGSGNSLSGVKFALEDSNGNVLRELVSGDDGIVSVTDLTLGTYIIRETEAPEGFVQTEETITVTIDENYVVPAELYKLVNHSITDIQTGVDITITPVMWAGAAMVLAAIALMVSAGVKKRKHRHKTARRKAHK